MHTRYVVKRSVENNMPKYLFEDFTFRYILDLYLK